MEMFNKYKSPLGYQTGANQIDSYGVDHSGFTLRDELAYQMARQQRENQIIKNFHNQGITQDYPQAGNNFWGNSPDNNFGFGSSQISSNIENMQSTPVPNVVPKSLNKEQLYTPPSHAAGVLAAGIKGFGQGTLGSIEHGINTATSGAYDGFNDIFLGGGYEKRQQELEKLAQDVNLEKPYKYANYATDTGVNASIGGIGTKKAKDFLSKAVNLFK